MVSYVALLRGINVGGNNIIKMSDLKACFEKAGYANVRTYIQSGNVLFESSEKSIPALEKALEKLLSKRFNYTSTVLVRSQAQLKQVLQKVPSSWKKDSVRKYVAFIKQPTKPRDVLKEVFLREGVDSADVGPGVLYLTTVLSELGKSGFSKLAGKKVYQVMTIRNYNTTNKLNDLFSG